ncbi:MAG: hypothetical protein IPN58_04160 [Anaerolineales bacterium]|nr:hypothetical protein [Anaerolineales bacterium]
MMIYASAAPTQVTNSTFSGNTASYGGGIYTYDNNTLTVTNTTFSGSSASSGATAGCSDTL